MRNDTSRETFEAQQVAVPAAACKHEWVHIEQDQPWLVCERCGLDYSSSAATALNQAQQVAVPAGYVLVPIEPTIWMQQAALDACRKVPPTFDGCAALPIGYELSASAFVYRAMLAAAPQGDKK
jgi:hypothetical protein